MRLTEAQSRCLRALDTYGIVFVWHSKYAAHAAYETDQPQPPVRAATVESLVRRGLVERFDSGFWIGPTYRLSPTGRSALSTRIEAGDG